MRVLLVSQHFPPDGIGGVDRVVQALAAELTRAGDTVSIAVRRITRSPQMRTVRERLPDGTTLYVFSGGAFRGHNFLLHDKDLERLFTAALLDAAPDVVHFHHLRCVSPRSVAIAQRLRAATVISLHDFYFVCPLVHLQKPSGELCAGPDGGRECARTCFADEGASGEARWGLRALYFRRLLAMAQRYVCYSRYVASYFQNYGLEPARVHVIPHGVPAEVADPAARPAPAERGVLKLGYGGTVVPLKGPHVILEALRIAELGPVDLVLFGQAPDRAYARQLREQAAAIPGLKLRLYGSYERGELPHLLHDIDCMIQPSVVPESAGIVPREAMARGIPVVVSRLGALPEIVTEGENGLTFDPFRPGELAAVLRRLVWEKGLLERLRAGAARTHVVTVAEHAEAVRAVYRRAADDGLRDGFARRADVAEAGFLQEALVGQGFGRLEADGEDIRGHDTFAKAGG